MSILKLPEGIITLTERDDLCAKGLEWKVCGRPYIIRIGVENTHPEFVNKLEEHTKTFLENLNRDAQNTRFVMDNLAGINVSNYNRVEIVLTPVVIFEPQGN